jgi:hypothetical protein
MSKVYLIYLISWELAQFPSPVGDVIILKVIYNFKISGDGWHRTRGHRGLLYSLIIKNPRVPSQP